ncbi:hypothetical protein F66182_9742 [Fusarium sp. NRRL 66182]|nr:hypothetical protein F66182_9742 [Fusarium sp. NRRL 66182]
MSNRSVGDSDIEHIDLSSDDEDCSESGDQDEATPEPQVIYLQVDEHGDPIPHIVDGPELIDLMDVDDEEESEGEDGEDEADEDSFGPSQPENNEDSGGDAPGDDPGDDGDDDGSGDDESSDSESDNDEDEEADENDAEEEERFGASDPNAGLAEVLQEAGVQWPVWTPHCNASGCQPSWMSLAYALQEYRRRFLEKKQTLADSQIGHRRRARDFRRTIRDLNRDNDALKEAVSEFYAANESNIEVNRQLRRETELLRRLVPPEVQQDLPDLEPLPFQDMEASLPQRVLRRIPDEVRMHVPVWRRSAPATRRQSQRTWPKAYRFWVRHGRHRDFNNWGDVYKQSCKEENMSWAFSETVRPKTHPYLTLRAPTAAEEARAIGGEGCTPQPDRLCPRSEAEENIPTFRFNDLDMDLQLKILQKVLVFKGKIVHAISRLDPYYEPSSVHRNCNNQTSLFHRFHIGRTSVSLTFGAIYPQRLLAPLLVSRQWHLMGANLFYGANKFGFSSIGE